MNDATRRFLSLAAVGVLALSPGVSHAEPFTQAEITQIFNEVKTLDSEGARPSRIRETIQGVQSVKTGMQSRAELTFPDKSLTRLGGNTIFSFQQGTRELELKQGTILFEVPKGNGGAKIRTAAITAAITGTTGFYEYSPKAGSGGILKFGILEGSANLYIKGRLGHFITVGAGQMVICPANLRDFNSTEVVHFEIDSFIKTCALINKMGGLPSLYLVEQAIGDQGKLFNRSKELFLTNLFIPGGGTQVILSDINNRFTANNPLATPIPTSQGTGVPTPARFGPLPTINKPVPYVINSTTNIQTDPTITTNGAANSGRIYRGPSQDGLLTNYLFGSTSNFDSQNGLNSNPVPSSGIAAFKFSSLLIEGSPFFDTTNGPTQLALISETGISTGSPGGVFALNALDGLLLGTVNGSIVSGPEMSYLRTTTSDFFLEFYARGTNSDILFNSTVNLAAGELDFVAQRDVTVNSQITAPIVEISAGNNFTLGSSGLITASSGVAIFANNVAGTGSALISTPNLTIGTTGPVSLTQAISFQQGTGNFQLEDGFQVEVGGLLSVNSIQVDQKALQNLAISASSLSIDTDIVAQNLNLSVASTSTPLSLANFVSVNSFSATAPDIVGNGFIDAVNLSLTFTSATATIGDGEGGLSIQNVNIGSNRLFSLTVVAPDIEAPDGLFFNNGGPLTLIGNVININGLFGTDIALLGNATVFQEVEASGNLTIQNLFVQGGDGGGSVSANTISRGFVNDTPHTLTADFISAPGGLFFNGLDGGPTTAPGNGGILTISTGNMDFEIGTEETGNYVGAANFNGGNAPIASAFAGGNGGNLTINAYQGITVNAPISATTGANGIFLATGGAGGNVNLNSTSDGPQVNISSTIDVSSNNPATRQVSRSGGNIRVTSATTTGTAINVTNTAALRSLLNAAAPGPGGVVQIVSAGGDINFNGTAQADRGTVDIHINSGGQGFSNLNVTNATISADMVKLAALSNNGQLNINGGSINANTLMKLYAGGSNGSVNFIGNVTLSGGTKIIAANTVSIQPGGVVTVNGSTASVYANTRNFVGGNSSTPNPGRFTGSGAPTSSSIHPFSGAPGF